jgi:hypothetical protein
MKQVLIATPRQMEDKDRNMESGTIRQEAKVENKNKDRARNKATV